jgi:hypothetical protein
MSEDPVVYQTNQVRTDKRNRIKQHANRVIWVTFQREGIHKYPAAATDPNLADVSFLANEHRHIFHFKVAIEVTHNDRDIEFIQFKRWLEGLYQGTLQLNYKSCEMICDDLYEEIATRYPDRFVEITVSEDGENGATITYNTVKPNLQVVI